MGLLQETRGKEAALAALEEGVRTVAAAGTRAHLLRILSRLSDTVELRARLGQLLEQHELPEDAESSDRLAPREQPAHVEALEGIFRLYQAKGALDRYDAILTRTLSEASVPAARRALLLRRARLRTTHLGRDREALSDLEQLLLADPADIESLLAQEEILERNGQHDELVKAYERHLEHCKEVEEKVDSMLALAILYENRLHNPEKAIAFYRRALQERPEHVGAHDSLATLLEKRRDWLGAIQVLGAATEKIHDPEMASGELHFRRGQILEEQLLRPGGGRRGLPARRRAGLGPGSRPGCPPGHGPAPGRLGGGHSPGQPAGPGGAGHQGQGPIVRRAGPHLA